ncbi:hypothetical protein [Streptomyces longispororuber]|uniref:hypothetical protein n=1 Tax=Streptomyces longispororuber TaxID=68230 RepID=UPI0036F5D966
MRRKGRLPRVSYCQRCLGSTPLDGDDVTDTERPLPLTPLDGAHLARAHLRGHPPGALADLTRPAAGDQGPNGGARHLLDLSQQLLRQAVVVERGSGACWTAVGEAAGTTRQAAHERWSTAVEGVRKLTDHRRTGIHSAPVDEVAAILDAWCTDWTPAGPTPSASPWPPSSTPLPAAPSRADVSRPANCAQLSRS